MKEDCTENLRYSEAELEEFRQIILDKRAEALKNLEHLQGIMAGDGNDVMDTSPTFKNLEEGSNVLSKEQTAKLAARLQKFIRDLDAALVRIQNGTYGVCRATGKLIPKERLRIVPHTTMTVEGKEMEKRTRRR